MSVIGRTLAALEDAAKTVGHGVNTISAVARSGGLAASLTNASATARCADLSDNRHAHTNAGECQRIERAREMLVALPGDITDIALACAFGSTQHFATVFRKHVGVTPTAFRLSARA